MFGRDNHCRPNYITHISYNITFCFQIFLICGCFNPQMWKLHMERANYNFDLGMRNWQQHELGVEATLKSRLRK